MTRIEFLLELRNSLETNVWSGGGYGVSLPKPATPAYLELTGLVEGLVHTYEAKPRNGTAIVFVGSLDLIQRLSSFRPRRGAPNFVEAPTFDVGGPWVQPPSILLGRGSTRTYFGAQWGKNHGDTYTVAELDAALDWARWARGIYEAVF